MFSEEAAAFEAEANFAKVELELDASPMIDFLQNSFLIALPYYSSEDIVPPFLDGQCFRSKVSFASS